MASTKVFPRTAGYSSKLQHMEGLEIFCQPGPLQKRGFTTWPISAFQRNAAALAEVLCSMLLSRILATMVSFIVICFLQPGIAGRFVFATLWLSFFDLVFLKNACVCVFFFFEIIDIDV